VVRSISPFVTFNQPGFFLLCDDTLITRICLVNVGYWVGAATGAGLHAAIGVGESTNAIGSSGVDPRRLLASIEICPSPIGDSLDTLRKSRECSELSSSSVLDIHRMMDAAVWGGGTESALMRPTEGSLGSAGCFDRTAP